MKLTSTMGTIAAALLASAMDTGIGGDDLEFTGYYDSMGRPIARRRRHGRGMGRPRRPGRLYPGHPDAPDVPPGKAVVVVDEESAVEGAYFDDDIEGDDDDDDDDLLGDDEDDDLIEGDDDDLEGFDDDDDEVLGELGARKKAAERKLKRLRRRRDKLEAKLDRARTKVRKRGLKRRIKRLNKKIRKLEGKNAKRSGKISRKKARRTGRKSGTRGRGQDDLLTYSGSTEMYPPGGKQIIIPMEPAVAPAAPDWVGALGNPLVTALIPAGFITAPQPMAAPQMPWLKYQVVGLQITEDQIEVAAVLGQNYMGHVRGLIDNFTVGGGEDLLPVAGMCPTAPWSIANELPAPALRNNPVVESPNVCTLDLLAAGTATYMCQFTVSLVANIIADNLGAGGAKVQKYQMLARVAPR